MAATTPLVVLGEVRTCLLPSAAALPRAEACELLELVPGRGVRWRERPGTLAVSPTTAVGVDCDLALNAETARIVGTAATTLVLAGGRILQSSAHVAVVRAPDRRRRPWSHYISRKGVVEVLTRIPERASAGPALAESYLAERTGADILDLASISERTLARIRSDPQLDMNPPLHAGTTRLRWTAQVGGSSGPAVGMRLVDDTVRTVRLIVREEPDLQDAQRFCEDLAVHDWLLTALARALDEADRFPSDSRERLGILGPALEHLTRLWMPGAHTPVSLRALWKELQNDPGFTRQWNNLVGQLRDSIAVATLDALRHRGSTADR
ncbi:SCO2521 family protein [Nocardia jiangsuensis]|uniref:SCO2521 family protein n=1 Tax=Nocardia jiangsuensis TaxID=1691563 RepID=A0ABV8DS61_9NOCA